MGASLPCPVSCSPGNAPRAGSLRQRPGTSGSRGALYLSSPNVGFAPISELYHAPGTTPEEQATLVLMWQGTQGMFNEVDTAGFLLWTTGFIVLGVAMLKAPAFGKGFGGVSIVLGALGVVGITVFGVDSLSFAPFGFPAYVVFPLLFGWKVYSLSKAA